MQTGFMGRECLQLMGQYCKNVFTVELRSSKLKANSFLSLLVLAFCDHADLLLADRVGGAS